MELDEIWVRGETIAQRIEAAEDDFFALYNELNTNNRFDVSCGVALLDRDTMVFERRCAPEFAITYAPTYYEPSQAYLDRSCFGGYNYLHSWNSQFDRCVHTPGREVVVNTVATRSRTDYQRNVFDVIQRHPQLQEKMDGLAGLYAEMEQAQKRFVELKPAGTPVRGRKNPRQP